MCDGCFTAYPPAEPACPSCGKANRAEGGRGFLDGAEDDPVLKELSDRTRKELEAIRLASSPQRQAAAAAAEAKRKKEDPQGLTQILVNALDRGMNPQQAVDAPRFKLIMQSGAVHIDPQFSLEVGNKLVTRGHQLGDSYGFASFKGAAQMLRIHRDASGQCTSLEAGVDHRLDGVALGF